MQEVRVQKGGANLRRQFMEHRWGSRVPVDIAVQLEVPGRGRVPGQMLDASVSGAFIRTALKLPALSALRVIVVTENARIELPACVARVADGGLGLEWRDMACPELLEILHADRDTALAHRDRVFG